MDTATKITLSFGLGFIGYQRGETTGIVFGTMEEAQAGLGGELISDAVLGINGDSLVLR